MNLKLSPAHVECLKHGLHSETIFCFRIILELFWEIYLEEDKRQSLRTELSNTTKNKNLTNGRLLNIKPLLS